MLLCAKSTMQNRTETLAIDKIKPIRKGRQCRKRRRTTRINHYEALCRLQRSQRPGQSFPSARLLVRELTVSCESQSKTKSYLGIFLSILVLMLISSLIVAAIVIINPEITNLTSRQFQRREAITLEEAILGEIGIEQFEADWLVPPVSPMSSQVDELLYEDNKNLNILRLPLLVNGAASAPSDSADLAGGQKDDKLQQKSPTTTSVLRANVSTLVSNSSLLSSIDNQGYKLSPSGRYLLIWTAKKRQFRHSFTAKYFIYDTQTDMISLLGTTVSSQSSSPVSLHNQYEPIDTASSYVNEAYSSRTTAAINLINNVERNVRFQSVDWFSATNSTNNDNNVIDDSLILVQNNDIYLLDNVGSLSGSSNSLASDESVPLASNVRQPIRLTFTGKQSEVFNGVADWLYEEEILADSQAFQVSPGGSTLAYMSFNDSLVSQMPFTVYGSSEQVVPRVQRIRYPKAGQVNPTVSVNIIDNLVNAHGRDTVRQSIRLELPRDLAEEQHYIVTIKWLTNEKLALIWLRREQNLAFVVICNKLTGWQCEKNLKLEAPPNGWLEIGSDDIKALDKNYYLLLMLKHEGDDVGSFKHIAKVSHGFGDDKTNANNLTYLSSGRREVTLINGVDIEQELVYYTSTLENEPGQRHLFVGDLSELRQKRHQRQGRATTKSSEQVTKGVDDDDKNDSDNITTKQTSTDVSAVCMSCHYYPQECLYNHIRLSPSGRHFVLSCMGPSVPRIELRKCPLRAQIDFERQRIVPMGKVLRSEAQSERKSTLDTIQLVPVQSSEAPKLRRHNVPATSDANDIGRKLLDSIVDDTYDNNYSNKLAATESLLWVAEQNSLLKERLEQTKAMPLNFRLKVPLPNSNHSANVLLLLPPQFSSTTNYVRSASSATAAAAATSQTGSAIHANYRSSPLKPINSQAFASNGPINQQRARRNVAPQQKPLQALNEQPSASNIGSYYTLETIQQYIDQLTQGQGPFPMVVDVYGGPGSQKVDFRFGLNFGHYLASNQRIVYALIDGRGSGFQGTKRLHELYHKFGTIEIADQIDVAAYLSNRFSFIDRNRIGIWGWSYGGYAAAMALAQSQARAIASSIALSRGSLANLTNSYEPSRPLPSQRGPLPPRGVFECAVSVAPVTNWIYYDTAYTERYMSSPYMNGKYDLNRVGDHLSSDPSVDASLATSAPNRNPLNEQTNTWQHLNQTSLQNLVDSPLLDLMFRSQRQVSSSASTNTSQQQQAPNVIRSLQLPLSMPPPPPPSQRLGPVDLNQHYRSASLMENIKFIDRKRFLLIHGTADDNVHFQQSIMLMKQLIQRNILYETRFYPDQDHAIANRADKLHLGSTITNFFDECFEMPAYSSLS